MNPMQFVLLQRRVRQRQMSAMYRIEGPAKQSYIHGIRSAPPSVQIPGLRCKSNHTGIVRLAVVRPANGHFATFCSRKKK